MNEEIELGFEDVTDIRVRNSTRLARENVERLKYQRRYGNQKPTPRPMPKRAPDPTRLAVPLESLLDTAA